MEKLVITIGRQCGSGGHSIGKLLAGRLGLAFYDKEIVELTAAKTKLSPEFIRTHGEYFHGGALGHIMGYGTRFDGPAKTGSALTDQLHQAQSEIIQEVAAQEPCVIVGRCADYALENVPGVVNVFLYADLPSRIVRIARRHDLTDAKAKDLIRKTDKSRASYYNYYTSKK